MSIFDVYSTIIWSVIVIAIVYELVAWAIESRRRARALPRMQVWTRSGMPATGLQAGVPCGTTLPAPRAPTQARSVQVGPFAVCPVCGSRQCLELNYN